MRLTPTDAVIVALIDVANFARGIAQMKNGDSPALTVVLEAPFLIDLRKAVEKLDATIAANSVPD